MKDNIHIRKAVASDLDKVLSVERAAFETDGEAKLTHDLLQDPEAQPVVSLLAMEGDEAIGHILFTRAGVESDPSPSAYILAPLAVIPPRQKQGVGGKLIRHGLRMLSDSGVDLVFVLGHTDYYPRFGFKPALPLGFEPPQPVEERHADAWMVLELTPGTIEQSGGRVHCAPAMNTPSCWRE